MVMKAEQPLTIREQEMSIRSLVVAQIASLTLLASACADYESDTIEPTDRNVYFDGAEIKAALQDDPNTTFFADVRNGITNHFDQSEESIDFSHFLFQCPSMPGPVPMDEFLASLEADVSTDEYWSIKSAQTLLGSETSFRSTCFDEPLPPECWCECPPLPEEPPRPDGEPPPPEEEPPPPPEDCVIMCQ